MAEQNSGKKRPRRKHEPVEVVFVEEGTIPLSRVGELLADLLETFDPDEPVRDQFRLEAERLLGWDDDRDSTKTN